MRQVRMLVVAVIVAGLFLSAPRADDSKKDEAKAANKLVGTWKMKSAMYGGQDFKLPDGSTHIKHITPAQFMWATYDAEGKVTRSAGGPCTLKGDTYEETPEYGISSDFDIIKGKAQSFKVKVDGNKLYQNGTLSNGLAIEEVWERVESK